MITFYKTLRILAYIIAGVLLFIAAFKNCNCHASSFPFEMHLPNKEEICERVKEELAKAREEKMEKEDLEREQKEWCDRYAGHLSQHKESGTNCYRDRD